MDRVTKKLLQDRVDYLSRLTGRIFYIQSAYGNGYRLYERYMGTESNIAEHELTTYRLRGNNMRWFIDGIIAGVELMKQ